MGYEIRNVKHEIEPCTDRQYNQKSIYILCSTRLFNLNSLLCDPFYLPTSLAHGQVLQIQSPWHSFERTGGREGERNRLNETAADAFFVVVGSRGAV